MEYGLSAYYGNAYLLQAAKYVWHASIAEKRSYRAAAEEGVTSGVVDRNTREG